MVHACRFLAASAVLAGVSIAGCGFDWEAAYAARFGQASQGGTAFSGGGTEALGGSPGGTQAGGFNPGGFGGSGAGTRPGGTGGVEVGGTSAGDAGGPNQGGSSAGGSSAAGGSVSSGGSGEPGGTGTGGASPSGGNGAAHGGEGGAPPCSDNLVINAGFEAVNGSIPASFTGPSSPNPAKGEYASATDHAAEGTHSLFVNTIEVKNPVEPYLLLITSFPWAVKADDLHHLSAAAYVTDEMNPVRVAILYYDSQGATLASPTTAPGLTFSPPSSGFVFQGPMDSTAPAGASSASVAVMASTGVSAYVDALCVTR